MARLSWEWGIMGVRKCAHRNFPIFCLRGQWFNFWGEECHGLIEDWKIEDGGEL